MTMSTAISLRFSALPARVGTARHMPNGRRLTADSRSSEYGYRYYDPVTGRWPSRDPIGEKGGINLYEMAFNDPLNEFDSLGALTFRVDRTEYRKDLGLVPTAVIPTDTPSIDKEEVIATTSIEWTIHSKCKCDKNDGKFYLFDTIIRMHSVVHYRPSYSTKREERFAKHGEQDHVGDFKWWGRNEGRKTAQLQETKQEKKPFDDKDICESSANSEMQEALRSSAGEEAIMSFIEYDSREGPRGGPHRWSPAQGR